MYYKDDEDGSIILFGDRFHLKLDNKRLLYIRDDEKDIWKVLNKQPAVPIGFNREEKKSAIEKIYNVIEMKKTGGE